MQTLDDSIASEPRAVRDFFALSSVEERDDLLQKHLFWKDENVQEHLSGKALLAIIEHIRLCLLDYVAKNPDAKAIGARALKASPGLLWSTPDHWQRWQQRLLDLRMDSGMDWIHAQWLLHDVLRYASAHKDAAYQDRMLPYAEQMMENGMLFDITCLIRVAWWPSCENSNPLGQLNPYPLVIAQLKDPQNGIELQTMALKHPSMVHWMNNINARIDAWSLAERCTTRTQLTELCTHLHDAALFKAWHGMPLNVEEIQIHPLAHSLYVHKHAPVYLAEVAPLPEYWRLAMELAGTGEEFKCLLLQGQSQKPLAETLALPRGFLSESSIETA